ncbi:MAG: hypothetical protein HY236_10165 [Acidobacteria bacterium]|nr:hypothetical protein [Acidobacteriota bacterium]
MREPIWLATGILWTFELHALEAAAAALGIGAVCLLRQLLRIELPAALVLGVLAATVFALSGAAPALFRKSRGDKSPRRPVSFRRAFYLVSPHFAYGSFYYLFLFSDRLLAWSARAGRAAPFVQFRGDYEMGLGLGLAAFIVLVGWVRASTAHFDRRRQEAQKSFTIFRLAEFDSLLAGHYYKWAACFLPAAAAVSAAIYCTARLLGMFSNPAAERVALWALAGFPLVVLGLRNVSLLFSLARPLPALAAIILAWLADIGAGYALLQIGSYEHAVIGFTLGAAIFAGVSGYCLVHTIHRLDYYYFASAA